MRRVVCVDDSECWGLTKGRTYLIRREFRRDGRGWVTLAGVKGEWLAERFEDTP